jgi:hypothetical protein
MSSHLRHELSASAPPERLVSVDRAALQNAINRCAFVAVEAVLGLRPRPIEAISAEWPGREDVTEWFGETCQSGIVLAPHVLLHGPSGGGKTQLLSQALKTFCTSCLWVLVDCSGIPGPQQLFEELLSETASAVLACCTRLVALVGSVLVAEGVISERMAAAPLVRKSRMLHSFIRALTEAHLVPACVAARVVEFRELDVLSTILQWLPRHEHADAVQESLSAASNNPRLSDPTRIELLAQARLLAKRDTAPRCKTLSDFTAQLRQLCSLTVADVANVAVVALLGVLAVPGVPAAETSSSRAPAPPMPAAAEPAAATSAHWSSAWPPALTSAHLSLRIGLDAAEHLLYLEGPVFTQLMQIQELTGRNISIFATTTAGPACVAATACLPLQPIQMHFPPPAPAEVVRLLQRDPIPAGGVANQALYNRFVELVERAFGQAVGYNVRELRRVVCALYPAFSLPVAQDGVPAAATRQLFDRVRPHFERMRGSLLQPGGAPELRPLPTATAYDTAGIAERATERASAGTGAGAGAASAGIEHPASAEVASALAAAGSITAARPGPRWAVASSGRSVELELSHCSKMLLLASFFASHNPAATDRRYFSTSQTGRNRVVSRIGMEAIARAKERQMLQGPRPAPLERIISIFYSLLAAAVSEDLPVDPLTGRYEVPYDDCELQLSTMCSLGLIDRVSAATELVTPRFSCRLPLEAAIRLSDGVGLKLANFIHDPTV